MKAFFLSRQFREKLLLLGLIGFATVMWGTALAGRAATFWREFRQTSAVLADQREWLGRRESVEAATRTARQLIDPSRTYDSVRLPAEMDTIARITGVSNTSGDDVRTERTTQFSVNSMQFTIRGAEYGALVRFYEELSKRAPYIDIQRFSVVANPSNPAQLSASLRVSSIEFAP